MKIYTKKTVLEASLDRIRYLFDEFENVVVGFSGGKDSTVTLQLALHIAREKNRLPLKVIFVDQEAEWQGTIDYVNEVMANPEIEPYWFQMPMVITNNASSYNRYSKCWDPTEEANWIHPKSPMAKTENIYGTERFHDLFEAIFKVEFRDLRSCYLAGVRTEESPKRYVALTDNITYKTITWGKVLNKKLDHYTFYPLYDWSYTDIWKYIHDHGIKYNRLYDEFYRHGVSLNDMRISNVHHETAIQSLLLIQEIEPKTWEKVSARIDGANTVKHIKKNSFTVPKDLPFMFESWKEYGLHLIENLIQDDKNRAGILHKIKSKEHLYDEGKIQGDFWRTIINTVLSSDWDWTKLANWEMTHPVYNYRQYKQGVRKKMMLKTLKYFNTEQLNDIMNEVNGTTI